MKLIIESSKQQLAELTSMALSQHYYYQSQVLKLKRRLDKGRSRTKNRFHQGTINRMCTQIALLERKQCQFRLVYEQLCQQGLEAERSVNQRLKNEVCFLSQVHDMLADQGMLPQTYMSRLNLGLRLAEKYRLN